MENMGIIETINFYKNKRILITGHTGFKGSWLTYLLAKHGAKVFGFALAPNTKPSLYSQLNLDNYCTSTICDINNSNAITSEIIKIQPDFIFHLAAQPLVRHSYVQTLETINTNIVGTANVLEACRSLMNKCCIVCVTTDKVYQNNEWSYPYREIDTLGGHDPYSASKAAAEIIIESYRKSFFSTGNIQVASARAGNVIGGGDWSNDRIIPDLVRSIVKNVSLKVRYPYAIRPWQHVLDPLFGYLFLAKKMFENPFQYDDSWNFGPLSNESASVLEICNCFIDCIGKGSIIIEEQKGNKHEAGVLRLDISKSLERLQWSPKWNTTKALRYAAMEYNHLIKREMSNKIIDEDINSYLYE
jgi:CDP-glucose 4,6-dehydratase